MNEVEQSKEQLVFAQRFRELRGSRTQAEFADFLGLSRPTVGLYESGKRVPDATVLKKIAKKCGVSADYLLGTVPPSKKLPYFLERTSEFTRFREDDIRLAERMKEFFPMKSGKFFSEQNLESALARALSDLLNSPKEQWRVISIVSRVQAAIDLYLVYHQEEIGTFDVCRGSEKTKFIRYCVKTLKEKGVIREDG